VRLTWPMDNKTRLVEADDPIAALSHEARTALLASLRSHIESLRAAARTGDDAAVPLGAFEEMARRIEASLPQGPGQQPGRQRTAAGSPSQG
jgi:hypothetical protein